MVEEIIKSFNEIVASLGLSNNQFFQGGFVLMVIGAILTYMRSVPKTIWNKIKRYLYVTMTIHKTDDSFWWMNKYLGEYYKNRRLKSFFVRTDDDL